MEGSEGGGGREGGRGGRGREGREGGGLFCHLNESCWKLHEMDRSSLKKISLFLGEGEGGEGGGGRGREGGTEQGEGAREGEGGRGREGGGFSAT